MTEELRIIKENLPKQESRVVFGLILCKVYLKKTKACSRLGELFLDLLHLHLIRIFYIFHNRVERWGKMNNIDDTEVNM